VIVVFCSRCWDLDIDGSKTGRVAGGERNPKRTWRSRFAVTRQPGLKLLIRGERQSCDIVHEGYLATGNVRPSSICDRRRAEAKSPQQRADEDTRPQVEKQRARPWKILVPAALLLVATLLGGGLYWHSRAGHRPAGKVAIVLGDFVNNTSDPVLEDALKQALLASLDQSPFLSILSDDKVRQQLGYMGRPAKNISLTTGMMEPSSGILLRYLVRGLHCIYVFRAVLREG
jgi:hypothetical protein